MTPLVLLLDSPELIIQQQAVRVVWGLACAGAKASMAIISAGTLLQLT